MSVGIIRPFDILNQMLDLKPRERIGYDQAKNTFLVVQADAPLSDDVTSSLTVIARRIHILIAQKGLQPEQILNFKLNLSIVNTLYHRYNAALTKHCFLNFLDKLILIITFGQVRLKYSPIESSTLDNETRLLVSPDVLDYHLTCRLVKYFSSDVQRINQLPQIVSALLETQHKLKNNELVQFVKVADAYAKVLLQNPKYIPAVPQKVLEALFRIANDPASTNNVDSILAFVVQELPNFKFRPDFYFMDNCGKEMMLNLAEIVQRLVPGKIYEVFKTPSSICQALDHIAKVPNKKELVQALLTPALSQFGLLSDGERDRLVTLANTFLRAHLNTALLDLRAFSSSKRQPLLIYLATSKDARVRASPLSRSMYNACLAHCNALEQVERSHYFVLLHIYDATFQSLAKSKQLLIDLIDTLVTKGNPQGYDVKRISSYVNEPDLTDSEKAIYIKFLAAFDLISSLPYCRAELHIAFLAGHTSLIPDLSEAAVQLCVRTQASKSPQLQVVIDHIECIYKHIDINRLRMNSFKLFVSSPWFNNCANQHLLKIDFSTISDEKFKVVSTLNCFHEKADIYLAKATDDHLTFYYGPREKNIEVNPSHINEPCDFKEKCLQPLPAGSRIPELNELLGIFDKLNFTDKSRPDYYDAPIFDDESSQNVSHTYVRTGLANLIVRITARQHYTAAPRPILPSGKPNPEFQQFFDMMTLCLRHIILELTKKPVVECSAVLIVLGLGGHHCAMRHKQDARQMYTLLTGETLDIDHRTASFVDMLFGLLMQLRSRLLVDIAVRINADVHYVNGAKKYVSPKLRINEDVSHNDPYEPYAWQAYTRKKTTEIFLREFYKKYKATLILNAAHRFFNDPLKTKDSDFRNKVMNAISSKLKPSDPSLGELIVYGDPDYPGFLVTREGLRFLLRAYNAFKSSPSPVVAAKSPRPLKAVVVPPPATPASWSITNFFKGILGIE